MNELLRSSLRALGTHSRRNVRCMGHMVDRKHRDFSEEDIRAPLKTHLR